VSARGFSLIEIIVTLSIVSILAVLGALVVVPAIDAYFAQQRRGELSEAADSAVRRLSRDIRLALPNSVRVAAPGNVFLEVLQTRTGGRYRSQLDDGAVGGEDILDFAAADTTFDTLGRLSTIANQAIVPNSDRVVVHNLGIAGASAYLGENISLVTAFAPGGGAAANEDRITITSFLFPVESPGRRFHVVSGPVTYECAPGAVNANGDGTGQLRRYDGYAIAAAQPTPPPVPPTIMAGFVTGCAIAYDSIALQARGVVSLRLVVTRAGDSVSLYHEVHVSNVP
jgi:MSHA biogenesis protein MshO